MKRVWKTVIAAVLSVMLIVSTLGVAAFAANDKSHQNLPYKSYTYLGDSIAFGYGLVSQEASSDPYSVGVRVRGCYGDLVGKALEKTNGATVRAAACSGARLTDYRILLERGMGLENPYYAENDWYGLRKAERTERLRSMGPEIVAEIEDSDLVSFQCGFNDLTAALINAACATGLIDLDKLQELGDVSSILGYLAMVLDNLQNDPDVVGNFTKTFLKEFNGIFSNAYYVVKDLHTIASEDTDVMIIGYYKAVDALRVIPGTDRSLLFDLVDDAIMAFNAYYRSLAELYDNVYYVDTPDATTVYPKGTTVLDALEEPDGILLGIHADDNGHRYIADQILNKLDEINA